VSLLNLVEIFFPVGFSRVHETVRADGIPGSVRVLSVREVGVVHGSRFPGRQQSQGLEEHSGGARTEQSDTFARENAVFLSFGFLGNARNFARERAGA
jgi:hypothetical protein